MKPHKVNENATCPHCGHRLDLATGIDHTLMPRPGDVSICIECASILIFDDAMMPREPTVDEWKELKETNQEAFIISQQVKQQRAELN